MASHPGSPRTFVILTQNAASWEIPESKQTKMIFLGQVAPVLNMKVLLPENLTVLGKPDGWSSYQDNTLKSYPNYHELNLKRGNLHG